MLQRRKKKKGREREKSTHWICQLVLLVDLKESISGRGGVGEEANYKEWVRCEKAKKATVTSLLHTHGVRGWETQFAPSLNGQWFCRRGWCSVLCNFGMEQSLARMPLNLTTSPWCCSDKSARILLWKGKEGGALECGDSDTQLPWPGAHKLSKPSRQCNRPPIPSHARVLKWAAGTLSILQTCCLRELSKASRASLHPWETHLARTTATIP